MSGEAVYLLVQATVASSAAALLVAALRRFLRYAVGARAAYWAWLFVPAAALVVLLPRAHHPVRAAAGVLSGPVRATLSSTIHAIDKVTPPYYAAVVLAVWIIGALLSLALMLHRHRAFVRSLGEMSSRPDGSLQAARCREPMLVGILKPRVVLPPDFDTRYAPNERAMVLAHEQAHLRRCDPQVNALAAVGLCLSWFNPLMHWALRLFRFDQELACDASALALSGATRRGYADALLKTQLTTDLARDPVVMGCHWHSSHPLTERIHMLKRPLPGNLRRRGGLALTLAFMVSGCYVVRTAQAELPAGSDRLIAINMRVLINGVDTIPGGAGWDVLVSNGGQFRIADAENAADCVARLRDASSDIVLNCRLAHPLDQVFATPTLIVRDNEQAWIGVTDPTRGMTFQLGFNASISDARLAETTAAIKARAANAGGFALQKP